MPHHITPARIVRRCITMLAVVLLLSIGILDAKGAKASPISEVIDRVQTRMVKIHGAGGFRGMEAYQTGFLVSPSGHVLTVFNHVLDTDEITVVLADGQHLKGKLLGADPRLEIALLKVEASDATSFDLDTAVEVGPGTRILAFSNLFGVATGNEPTSVQHGVISIKTPLEARRGVFKTPYDGPVYVLDAGTNNPGAAGGALVTRRGELIGMLGKELRNARNNTWLNYALPIAALREPVERIRTGKLVARDDSPADKKPTHSTTSSLLGLVLIPDVVERTPPYVDAVRPNSPAAKVGIRPDDLIILVDDQLVQSCKDLRTEFDFIDHEDRVRLTVLRDEELIPFELLPATDAFPES